jgi:hypothetical protein
MEDGRPARPGPLRTILCHKGRKGENTEYASCLDPASYVDSQQLARELLNQGSAGVIYPSVRRGGTCLACFGPALVINVRRGWVVTLEFSDAFAAPTARIDKGRKRQ